MLLIFQAMDAAGKDGTIKHVMSGVNPQGCDVSSFKAPSAEELDHDYLWRVPGGCRSGDGSGSSIARTTRKSWWCGFIPRSCMPSDCRRNRGKGHLEAPLRRHQQVRETPVGQRDRDSQVLLHVSKAEQKRRFLERIDEAEKNWKFSASDVRERACWDA